MRKAHVTTAGFRHDDILISFEMDDVSVSYSAGTRVYAFTDPLIQATSLHFHLPYLIVVHARFIVVLIKYLFRETNDLSLSVRLHPPGTPLYAWRCLLAYVCVLTFCHRREINRKFPRTSLHRTD